MYSAHQTLNLATGLVETGKVFCESPFALHRQQPESISQPCPTQMAYSAKNYVTILIRAAHFMTY